MSITANTAVLRPGSLLLARFGEGLARFGEGLPTPPKHPTEGLPIRQETFGRRRGLVRDRPQQWGLASRPIRRASPRFGEGLPGSARVSRPHRNVRPKVSPFARRPSVGGVARSETGHNSGGLLLARFGEGLARFGEGLPTPPKRPTEGLPIRQETFGRRRGSVRDRPQQWGLASRRFPSILEARSDTAEKELSA